MSIDDPKDVRPDIGGDIPDELPSAGGGGRTTLQPGIDTFKLPIELPQLWSEVVMRWDKDGQTYKRAMLKLTKDHPLVVVGGTNDGDVMTMILNNNPRPRPWTKRDEPTTPWVSDLVYLLRVGLNDKSPLPNGAEQTPALIAAINRHAGGIVRIKHGLSGQCRPDKVRRVLATGADGTEKVIEDPHGTKGCGKRYYTRDFKNGAVAGESPYDVDIFCKTQICAAASVVVRGFESFEEFLAPQGVAGAGAGR